MKCIEISKANDKLKKLKKLYRYHQILIDNIKSLYYDPWEYYYVDKDIWEKNRQEHIKSEGQILKGYEFEIRKLKKHIKELQRLHNKAYNDNNS